ncbi:MAG: LPS export ABC transporter periplasmic protein LptC [Candidatus Binatia bacterium]
MSRRRIRFVVLSIVVLGVVVLGVQLRSTMKAQKGKKVDSTVALEGMLPDAVQWIQDFHRIEIKDGKTAWEVRGEEAQYLEEKEQVLVRGPKAAFFTDEGEKVQVAGGEATVGFDGRDLKDVSLHDNVEIHFRDFVIHMPQAVYRHADKKIVADGPVDIKGQRVELQGYALVVFMDDSRFELGDPVRVTLLPESAASRRS